MWHFSRMQKFFRDCSTIHLPALFFEVEISSCTLIPLFILGSVHSGSTSNSCMQDISVKKKILLFQLSIDYKGQETIAFYDHKQPTQKVMRTTTIKHKHTTPDHNFLLKFLFLDCHLTLL